MVWLKLLLLVLVNAFLALVVGRTVPYSAKDDRFNIPYKLEEVISPMFRAFGFNGTWKSNKSFFYDNRFTGDVLEFDLTTKTSRVLFDDSVTSPYAYPTVTFSHDDAYLLIGYDITAGFRHSTYRKFAVYDTKRKTYEDIANATHIPLAKWSPAGNALVYVLENDIYYQEFTAGSTDVRRLTTNGVSGKVYNGVPDWVYEEEVLGTATALWFSPDGNQLAFASFDDAEVKDAMFLLYGEPGSLDDQYPTEVNIKYPKAGTTNPIVSLSVVDLTNPSSKVVNLEQPTDIVGVDHILYTVNWWDSKRVVATWTNRVQNKAQLVLYDIQGAASNLLYDEEAEGWLRIRPPVYHDQYVIVQKLQDSGTDAGRFLHATRYEYVDGALTNETDLTPGPSELHSILSVDHARGRLYYLATAVGEPSQRNLYQVLLDGSEKPTCISCTVRTPEGNNCTYATATFSLDSSFYELSCSGPDPVIVQLFDADHKEVAVWEDNQYLRTKLAWRAKPIVKDLYVRANGYDSKVRLLLPPNFDEKKSYPLLIHVYAGPNTVRITEAASYGFHSYMTTNRSVIYGWIDGRGSAFRGSKMLFEIYRRMGTVEVQDQIDVTRALQRTYSWIDASRTGIWGWSYGGFSTGMALATDSNSVFKCGISVAPVSSWIYYDSIYTERFMGLPTPEDNLKGYNESDITRKVEGIRGKKYMLIHGTGDDNVHYQQAMALSKALVHKDILFEQVSYTDEVHGLFGVSAHLYHTMDGFWGECLGLSHAH